MCLAIPGRVLDAYDRDGLRMARVDFGGVRREVCLGYVPEARLDDYVLVHVGFAIAVVDEAEARRTWRALEELDGLEELEAPDAPRPAGEGDPGEPNDPGGGP